jgi:hypothetical protein
MISQIPYLYRDAANYQQHDAIYLDRVLTPDELALIESKLDSGQYFIPGNLTKVRVEELQSRMTSYPSSDDHVYHEMELEDLEELHKAPCGAEVISTDDFVASFAEIVGPNGWDEATAMERLGL